ncbi:hypothetical protein V6N11_014186 [Hibiscus sabdariffa]|uniref:Uncharacterized protein n=1 Tax=Hibiscus sabdariffa TaxID=183260 RepID=A0ABR2AFZ6_9ROSI
MRSDSRSFNSSYPSPSSGRKRKSTPSNWSSFLAGWPRSARGQCTRAPAQIGAFFSLACAFVPHSFKSKEAPSVRDRDGALAWLAAGELSLDKSRKAVSLFGKSVLQVLWSEQSTEPALPEACGEWGRKTRQSLSLREKRNIAKTETPRLKSRRSDRRKVLSLVWRTNPISYLSSSGTLAEPARKPTNLIDLVLGLGPGREQNNYFFAVLFPLASIETLRLLALSPPQGIELRSLYRATIGLIENERGSLDRVPSIVRRASSATPVPVVNETFFLLLSGLRLSFKGSTFFGSFGQGSTGKAWLEEDKGMDGDLPYRWVPILIADECACLAPVDLSGMKPRQVEGKRGHLI